MSSLTNSVPPSNEPLEETEPQLGQVRNRLDFPSPNIKRQKARDGESLRECGQEEEQGCRTHTKEQAVIIVP